jgi:(E)-4-hydroxy-3-methylbut-2-enyl-diphosphate synthase
MRIGTNHGSLSDRIMSRYGDTYVGMVESAMEFLRIARDQDYHNIVLSMKASNPQVMVQAYRLLTDTMLQEFGECYPLHLGVTEAGDGEDGRVKSAVGMGTLLEQGIGDTVRVSLTEEPEAEIPVCRDLVKRYPAATVNPEADTQQAIIYSSQHKALNTRAVNNIGASQVPVVIADGSHWETISPQTLQQIGYTYDEGTDKWSISDVAADYLYAPQQSIDFALPGTLKIIVKPESWIKIADKTKYFPIFEAISYLQSTIKSDVLNFVQIDCTTEITSPVKQLLEALQKDNTVVLCLSSEHKSALACIKNMYHYLQSQHFNMPSVIVVDSHWQTADEHLIHYATEAGALLLDGWGNGVCFGMPTAAYQQLQEVFLEQNTLSGRNYNTNTSIASFVNATAFSILQATRTRISKTEYISCPSCGRTLFDLQETTAMIRNRTHHLKGVKIAIMGCIVNGPGEMADADFGYVGSGVGKITLYKGKEVIKKNVDSEIAVAELINLLKENNAWVEPA